MSAPTLRDLAKAYAKGELDKLKYRKSRKQLLDGIVLGDVTVADIDFPPPVIPPAPEAPDTTQERPKKRQQQAEAVTQMGYKPTQPAAPSQPAEKPDSEATTEAVDVTAEQISAQVAANKSNLVLYLLIGGIVVLLIAIVISLTGGKDTETAQPGGTQTLADEPVTAGGATGMDTATGEADTVTGPETGDTVTVTGTDTDTDSDTGTATADTAGDSSITRAASDVIDGFLNDRDWSRRRIEELILQWQGLGEEDRASVTGSGEWSQLVNAIYKQLLEEKALSAIGDAETSRAKQQVLIDMAERLGIDDNRIRID